MTHDTTPGAAGADRVANKHVQTILEMLDREYDDMNVARVTKFCVDSIRRSVLALDAARRDAEARADAAEERVERHKRLALILGEDMPLETLGFMIDLADDLDAARRRRARADGGA